MRFFRRGERASTLDLLVAGLGNPGRQYERTRHNLGWLVVDELARRHGGSWRSKFSGSLAETRLDGSRIALLKPETYMNESGRSVGGRHALLQGRARVAAGRPRRRRPRGRSPAGAARRRARRPQRPPLARAELGTQDFLRLRIGVGRPGRGDPRSVSDWVLSGFEPEDDVEALVSRSADAAETIVREGLDAAQARFN